MSALFQALLGSYGSASGGGGGGDPAIRSQQTGTSASATSHSVAMPPSVAAGDRIVVVLALSTNRTVAIDTGASGTGWTVHQDLGHTGCKVWVASKTASGSDALTVTLGLAAEALFASIAVQHGATLRSAALDFDAPGSDTANPVAVTGLPSGAAAVCLVGFSGNGAVTTAGAPSGYTLLAQLANGGQVFAVTKALTGTTEDPGAWAPGGNTAHVVATVVITEA